MHRLSASTAAVNVNDAGTVPDTEVFIVSAGEETGGRMTDDAGGVTVRAPVRVHPAPDVGIAAFAGKTVNKVELPETNYDIQMIRQTGKKAQDRIPFMGRSVIEQFPVGGHSAVLPPEFPGAVSVRSKPCPYASFTK